MIGENADGEEVRGRFVLRYSNSCDATENGVAVREGDVLAWNVWSEVEDQLGVFCPANNGGLSRAPTISPVGTLSPTVSSLCIVSLSCFKKSS